MVQKWSTVIRYKQIPQRSPAWYSIRGHYVTGSDFASLVPLSNVYLNHYFDYFGIIDDNFKKTKYGGIKTLKEWYGSRLKAQSDTSASSSSSGSFSAAAHGVLFEDVVFNLVAQKMGAVAKPLGLVICPHNDYCAISPDGVLCCENGDAMSLELKCVTTRQISTSHIPFSYFMQTEFAAWQLGCSSGIYCEADIMQVSEIYWQQHSAAPVTLSNYRTNGYHSFGLLLYNLATKTHHIPPQFIHVPSQFLKWRASLIKDDPDDWKTIYYKINDIQILKIPVRQNFETLFAPILKEHHDRLMTYTKNPAEFLRDFPSNNATKSENNTEKATTTGEDWLLDYAGPFIA